MLTSIVTLLCNVHVQLTLFSIFQFTILNEECINISSKRGPDSQEPYDNQVCTPRVNKLIIFIVISHRELNQYYQVRGCRTNHLKSIMCSSTYNRLTLSPQGISDWSNAYSENECVVDIEQTKCCEVDFLSNQLHREQLHLQYEHE